MNKESIRPRITRVLEDQSGLELSKTDEDVEFIELGLDSLFLTQASLAVSKEFGVEVTFRQLSETLTSIGAVAEYLIACGVKEPEQAAQAVPPVASSAIEPMSIQGNAVVSAPPEVLLAQPVLGSRTEDLIRAQILLMQHQLQVLSGQVLRTLPAVSEDLSAIKVPSMAQPVAAVKSEVTGAVTDQAELPDMGGQNRQRVGAVLG